MISLRRYSTSGANALATSSEMTIPNASAIVWTDCAERCVKSFCWAVADILSFFFSLEVSRACACEEKKVKKNNTTKTAKKEEKCMRSCVQTERVKYVPSRARREIFITQQQQLLLLFAYTMYTRAYKCAFVCVFPCAKQRSTESTCVLELFKRERSDVITVDYYFARSIASLFDWNLRWSFSREFFFFVFTSFSFFFPSLSLSLSARGWRRSHQTWLFGLMSRS